MTTQEQETIETLEEFANDDLFLIVTENQTGVVIHVRQLKDDDLLDVDSYLSEIEQATEISLDSESIAAGMGQYNIRIGFSPNPEEVYVWESKDFFLTQEDEKNDFDIWLSQNYIPAGTDASSGEEWYLSANPNEHLPYSLSSLKQTWGLENNKK